MKERILQGISPVFLLPGDYRLRMVRFEMVATFLALASCLFLQMTQSVQAQTSPTPQISTSQTPSPTAEIATPVVASQPQLTPPAAQTVAVTPAAILPCIPNRNYSASPTPIDLGSIATGLTMVRQGPYYYQVYGNDVATLRAQMMSCGPVGEFAGQASYTINWSYALRADETGLCRVVGVKIGVRTSMILPSRQVTGSESTQLIRSWQAFSSGLAVHEHGHVALTETYGQRLLGVLQGYPAGDCYTMNQGVEVSATNIVSELKSAQSRYDTTTAHGVTQGANF